MQNRVYTAWQKDNDVGGAEIGPVSGVSLSVLQCSVCHLKHTPLCAKFDCICVSWQL